MKQISVEYRLHNNPSHTLNEIKPKLLAARVVLEMENSDHWTHAQRSRFNFVLQEILASVADDIRSDETRRENTDDIGDIPF